MILKRDISTTLLNWRKTKTRKPLLIYGARQIGKSFSIRRFGEQNFKNIHEINFIENPSFSKAFEEGLNPENWYEDNLKNFGTKWDVTGEDWEDRLYFQREGDTLHLFLETAWTPPLAFLRSLCKKYGVEAETRFSEEKTFRIKKDGKFGKVK